MVAILLILALIIAICLIPVAFAAGLILGRENIRLGLQWQIEAKEGKRPTNPPKPLTAAQTKAAEKAAEESQSVTNEWINGPQPKKKDGAR